MTERLSLDDVSRLPTVLTTDEAAPLLGVTKDFLWQLAREGTAPVQPLKLGRVYRWPTAPLLALLGLNADEPPVPPGGSLSDPIDATLESRGSGAG